MKERPIIFNAPMVRAILEGRKTQTRRIGKQRGTPGEILWVKETFKFNPGGPIYDAAGVIMDSMDDELIYRADSPNLVTKWTPSIHMPRWASRITLEVTGVRVERLQDISEGDTFREGIQRLENHSWHATGSIPLGTYRGLDEWTDKVNYWVDPRDAYKALWKSIHGDGAWEKNPWVWVIEFKRVEKK